MCHLKWSLWSDIWWRGKKEGKKKEANTERDLDLYQIKDSNESFQRLEFILMTQFSISSYVCQVCQSTGIKKSYTSIKQRKWFSWAVCSWIREKGSSWEEQNSNFPFNSLINSGPLLCLAFHFFCSLFVNYRPAITDLQQIWLILSLTH